MKITIRRQLTPSSMNRGTTYTEWVVHVPGVLDFPFPSWRQAFDWALHLTADPYFAGLFENPQRFTS